MTAAGAGVPPEQLRPVLEALRDFATHATRMGGSLALGARQHGEKEALGNFNRAASAAGTLKDACAAALEASDAGTPDGELCPNCGGDGWYAGGDVNEPEQIQCEACQGTGKNEPPAPLDESAAAPEQPQIGVAEVDALQRRARHDREMEAQRVTFGTPASSAAPPTNAPEISTSLVDAAPDAELASLLEDLREGAELWGERRADTWTQSGAENADKACDEVCARIHAHVEKVKREAREAGRGEPGEADLRDAITSMTALEDELNYPRVTATFSYGDDADEIAFTGSDALDCCRQFIAWYRAAPRPDAGDGTGEP